MKRSNERTGFTLIELVVTMGIIAAIMGTFTFAVTTVVNNSREAATKATIRKIDGYLSDKTGEIYRYLKQERSRHTVTSMPEYITHPDDVEMFQVTRNRKLADMLARKRYMKRALPMTFDDLGITAPPGHDPKTENAECLYRLLTGTFTTNSRGHIAVDISTSEIADTDGDGLLEVVDAWGNPLRFYRWPTRMFRPQPEGSEGTTQDETGAVTDFGEPWFLFYSTEFNNLNRVIDPDDDFGLLISYRDEGWFSSQWFENNIHTIETHHTPLVVSAGEDGTLGLFEPTDTANKGYLAQPDFSNTDAMQDDITNW